MDSNTYIIIYVSCIVAVGIIIGVILALNGFYTYRRPIFFFWMCMYVMFSLVLYLALYVYDVFNISTSTCAFESVIITIPSGDKIANTHTFIFNKISNAVSGLLIESANNLGLIVTHPDSNNYIGYIVPINPYTQLPLQDLSNAFFTPDIATSCNTSSGCLAINLNNILSPQQKQDIGVYASGLPTCVTTINGVTNTTCKCTGQGCGCDNGGLNCTIYDDATETYNATAYTIT
jgi:hypothetical protein